MADPLTGRLAAHLSEATRRRFRRGTHDCGTFAADWVRRVSGVDPAAPLRGLYSTPVEADRIIADAGGYAPLIDRLLAGSGWRRAASPPRTGDLVLGLCAGHPEAALGICSGAGRVAFLTPRGLVIAPATIEAAWTPQ